MPVIAVSLLAAFAFAVAVVLQQHAAVAQPAEHHLRLSLLFRLVQRPLWLAGIGSSFVGTCLQLVALMHGSLVTVQPLLVCGLLFALPINAIWMHKRRPGARELLAALTVCIGLVVLLVATDPQRGSGTGSGEGWAITLGSLAVAIAVLVSCSLASHKPTWKAGLLACAGGLINGLSAAFAKGISRGIQASSHHGIGAVITHTLSNWELFAFACSLLCGVFLVQSAFQSGPIRWSLPALAAANPILSVVLGATLLHEQIRSGALPIVGAIGGLALVVAGIVALSSSNLIIGGSDDVGMERSPGAKRAGAVTARGAPADAEPAPVVAAVARPAGPLAAGQVGAVDAVGVGPAEPQPAGSAAVPATTAVPAPPGAGRLW